MENNIDIYKKQDFYLKNKNEKKKLPQKVFLWGSGIVTPALR